METPRLPDKIPCLTIPLFPLGYSGGKAKSSVPRIRPGDALDLRKMMDQLSPNILATIDVAGRPWSVIAAYSPYSSDIHVMVMETGVDRYIPGPEWLEDQEGDFIMNLWSAVLEFIQTREVNTSIHVGYNWSPWAWGEAEERGGFQSIPTKWHGMIWGWPDLEKIKQKIPSLKWIAREALSKEERRVLGENNYAEPFGWHMLRYFEKRFSRGSLFQQFFPINKWESDSRGIWTSFPFTISELLKTPHFYKKVLKPLARDLSMLMQSLSEGLTTMDVSELNHILNQIIRGPLTEEAMQKLRTSPNMRPVDYIENIWKANNWTPEILEVLMEPVSRRCEEKGDPRQWWRKGFGYALVLSQTSGKEGILRILPGLYTGPGGVVESLGVCLRRPLKIQKSDSEMKVKNEVMRELTDYINAEFRVWKAP